MNCAHPTHVHLDNDLLNEAIVRASQHMEERKAAGWQLTEPFIRSVVELRRLFKDHEPAIRAAIDKRAPQPPYPHACRMWQLLDQMERELRASE